MIAIKGVWYGYVIVPVLLLQFIPCAVTENSDMKGIFGF